jgi:hypothetical protein
MTPVDKPYTRLAVSVIERAVEDYIILRELGAVSGTEIRYELWNYDVGKNWRFMPIGYRNAFEVRELIEFLDGTEFDRLCDRLSTSTQVWPAGIIRERMGLRPTARPLLTSAELPWSHGHGHAVRNRKDGSSLPAAPLYNPTETNTTPDDDDITETAAA